jgi:hypothetical protein
VGADGGGTAQRKREAAGKEFSIENKVLWQTVEDEVQVDFANHAYIQYRHISPVSGPAMGYGFGLELFRTAARQFLRSDPVL